jgi:hypothetical protein
MSDATNGFKLLLSYHVSESRMQEYYRFMLGRYVPAMQAMGLEMSDAWHTAYGDFPNRLIGFVARDETVLDSVLENDTWAALNEEMRQYVTEFRYKVIPYREGFQF